jgi:hypothetical protein
MSTFIRFLSSVLFVSSVCIGLASCATPTAKIPQATGGSRADGTIQMSYQFGRFEQPVVQWDLAQQTAQAKCRAWGYHSAEAFGGEQDHCQAVNGFGDCLSTLVTLAYQCTGSAAPPK